LYISPKAKSPVSLLFLFLFLLSKTQKYQKYFHCFSLFASLVF
jgi:hypothetical protein